MYLYFKILLIIEQISKREMLSFLKDFFNYTVIPIEKNINEILEKEIEFDKEIEFVDRNNFKEKFLKYSFSNLNLKRKAMFYLKNNYSGVFLKKYNIVIGYMWFADHLSNHKDIKLLKFSLNSNSVYIFDLFIDEEYRGNNISTIFMNNALCIIKQHGYTEAYGYYSAGNYPSLWLHRTLGFTELPKLLWKRNVFLKRKSFPINIEKKR